MTALGAIRLRNGDGEFDAVAVCGERRMHGCSRGKACEGLPIGIGGLALVAPIFSVIFLFFTLANMSLPGSSSFIGEFLILVGAFQRNSLIATLAAIGMILGAAYSLWLYNRVVFGNFKPNFINTFSDLNRREFFIFLPFIFGVLWMGIYPEVFLESMHTSVSNLLQHGKYQ